MVLPLQKKYLLQECLSNSSVTTTTMKDLLLAAAFSVIRKGLDPFQRAASIPMMLTSSSLLLYFAQTSLPGSQYQATGLKQRRIAFRRF